MTVAQPVQIYRNVMEPLVADEVDKQLKNFPPRVTQYLNKAEVVAFALNRLPPLYATTQKGWQQQQTKASREMRSQIVLAVRQAFAAVQRDPLRSSEPLKLEADRGADAALQELKSLLRSDDLSWDNLVDTVEQVLIRTTRGEVHWKKRGCSLVEGNEWRDSRYFL